MISYENEERMLYNEKRKVRYTYINNAFALIVFSIAFYLSSHISHLGRAEQKDFLFSFLE